jgi:transposase InsO family protein/transposase-like protein
MGYRPERPVREPATRVNGSGVERRFIPSHETRLSVVRRHVGGGERVADLAASTGYSQTVLYNWIRRYRSGGTEALMALDRRKRTAGREPPEPDGAKGGPPADGRDLEREVTELRMELDVLKEAVGLLKKDHGVDLEDLSNIERFLVVDVLKGRWPVKSLCALLGLARSCYYYHLSRQPMRAIKAEVRRAKGEALRAVFAENWEAYGYRRLHDALNAEGGKVCEWLVRSLMGELGVRPKTPRKRKYSSYMGETGPAAPNLLERDFHAVVPGVRLLTDITEFALSDGKLYLSPVIDCYDGKVLTYTMGGRPDAQLVNTMLVQLRAVLPEGARPTIHSDQGCHYQWPGWIRLMKEYKWTRSMSRKGCSPDNSACEGFFGRLKNEVFHNRDHRDATVAEFEKTLASYIEWHDTTRIKRSLGSRSPDQHRRSLGLTA